MRDSFPHARVVGRSMMRGIDLGTGALADAVFRRAFDHGLVIETSGAHDEVVKVLAPLTTPDAVLLDGLEILAESAHQVAGERPAAGLPA